MITNGAEIIKRCGEKQGYDLGTLMLFVLERSDLVQLVVEYRSSGGGVEASETTHLVVVVVQNTNECKKRGGFAARFCTILCQSPI